MVLNSSKYQKERDNLKWIFMVKLILLPVATGCSLHQGQGQIKLRIISLFIDITVNIFVDATNKPDILQCIKAHRHSKWYTDTASFLNKIMQVINICHAFLFDTVFACWEKKR